MEQQIQCARTVAENATKSRELPIDTGGGYTQIPTAGISRGLGWLWRCYCLALKATGSHTCMEE